MTVSAFGVDDYRVAKAFGDAEKAKQANTRKKAGLATAGGGYLLASRTKDVSPGAADLLTRSPKKIGEAEHAARAAKKIKIMNRAGGRSGAALVGGGLALAGEGFVNDLRHRKVLDNAKKKIGKAYTPGEISYHSTQAQIHSSKATAADKRQRRGSAVAGAGLAGGSLGYHYAPQIARQAGRMADKTETHTKLTNAARKVTNVRRAALVGGAGVLAAGVGMNAEGASTAHRNRTRKAVQLKAVQNARERRNAAELGKAAGGSAFFAKADDSGRKKDHRTGATVTGGLATSVAAPAAGYGVKRTARDVAIVMQHRATSEGRRGTPEELKMARGLRRIARGASKAGKVGAAGGLTVAGAGVVRGLRRKEPVNKAFDSERQRHRRADMEAGALSGGTIVAGGGASALAVKASRTKRAAKFEAGEAAKKRLSARSNLGWMQTSAKDPNHVPKSAAQLKGVQTTLREADAHGATATKLARNSRRLGRGAIGTALGAGALGASAIKLHRSDRKGSGRSYGY